MDKMNTVNKSSNIRVYIYVPLKEERMSISYNHPSSKRQSLRLNIDDLVIFLYTGVFIFARIISPNAYRIFTIFFVIYIALFKIIVGKKLQLSAGVIWYPIFIVGALATLFYSSANDLSYYSAIVVTGGLLFAWSQYFDDKTKIRKILNYFAFWGIIFSVFAFTQANLSPGARLGNSGTLGYFTNAISFSYYIIVITSILIWHYIYEAKYRFVVLPSIVLSFYLAMMSGGRKAVILPLVFLIVLVWLKNAKSFVKLLFSSVMITAILFGAYQLSMNVPQIYDVFGYRIEQTVQSLLLRDTSIEASLSGRTVAFSGGLYQFSQSPIIGHGLGVSGILLTRSHNWSSHTHNNYVELLVSGGLLLFFAFYWIYAYILSRLIRIRKTTSNGLSHFFIAFIIMNLLSDFGTTSYHLLIFNNFIVLASTYIRYESQMIKVDS